MKTLLAIVGAGTVLYFAAQLNEAYVQFRIQDKMDEMEARIDRQRAREAAATAAA